MAKCELYQDVKGEWRWRRVDKKGDILDHSGQGFETEEECRKDGKDKNACTSYLRKFK
ncbi:hypothetical protein AB2B38_009140 [Balneola sp. MJW-20]|uniref:hypothetical protein n=1 Tax=Gracilimonas aurantiaca TaxID=3234185 RepID=UPI0034663DB7